MSAPAPFAFVLNQSTYLALQLAEERHGIVTLIVAELWIPCLCNDRLDAYAWVSLLECCTEQRPQLRGKVWHAICTLAVKGHLPVVLHRIRECRSACPGHPQTPPEDAWTPLLRTAAGDADAAAAADVALSDAGAWLQDASMMRLSSLPRA
jgi:hypothetical protein